MKKTFIRRVTSAVIALMMVIMPVPSGTFSVETDLNTAEAAETAPDITEISGEANSESGGGVKSSSPETIMERGGSPDGTDEPSETTVTAETSVTEPPAETEETAAPETETTSETEETENSDIQTEDSTNENKENLEKEKKNEK